MSYGENSGIHIGLFRGPPQLSEPEIKLLCWNNLLPRPVFHRLPDLQPRNLGPTACAPQRLWEWLLPWSESTCHVGCLRGQGHTHLSHHQFLLGLDMKKKQYGKTCMATSPEIVPSPNSQWLQPLQPGHGTPCLWTGQGRGRLGCQGRARDLILHISAVISSRVKWHIAQHLEKCLCFPSE